MAYSQCNILARIQVETLSLVAKTPEEHQVLCKFCQSDKFKDKTQRFVGFHLKKQVLCEGDIGFVIPLLETSTCLCNKVSFFLVSK